MKVGILEFRDNDFTRSVAERLSDLDVEFIRVGQISHPSSPPYDVIVDRISFCDPFLREVMKYWSLAGARVINDPFFSLNSDKLTELLWCDRLSIPHPRTVLLPRPNPAEDLREMVADPDWDALAAKVGFPCIVKPVDGYAWQDVTRVETLGELRILHGTLGGSRTLIVQELVRWVDYYRAFCVSRRDTRIVKWNPRPLDMGEYVHTNLEAIADLEGFIAEKTVELNAALGLDFNSVEWCVTADRKALIIDSNNDVPDVRKEKIPPESYDWIVDRFSACVRETLGSGPDARGG